jgi:uncharacterized membrane protein YidH (DUF202 family)
VTGAAAPQRTALAWRRTALSIVVVGLLMIRAGGLNHSVAVEVLGIAVLGAAAAFAWLGPQRLHAQHGSRDIGPAPQSMAAAGALITLTALAAGVVVLLC